MSKVLIIGGVAGGATLAARLRRLDESAEIILFERGEYISYANCGLPYHIGEVIKERQALLVQTPEAMKGAFNIDVRVKNEVISIDRENKEVEVKNLDTGGVYRESYDTLVISTGSSPLRPPIPGIDSDRIYTLWTIPDTDTIKTAVDSGNVKSAVVVGGGFIGLEVAENLAHRGLDVSLVEMLNQVMAPLDFEMAQLLHENIIQNGVDLRLGDGVDSFEDTGSSVTVKLKSGAAIESDIVVLSIGIRPNNSLAKEAGLELTPRGAIKTDKNMRTSDPSIYAVGDVAGVNDFVFDEPAMVPLAGPANKQARIAADVIAGEGGEYRGTQGTSVAQVFDLTAVSTGANEKSLIQRGMVKGKDYQTILVRQNSHAGYYPGAEPMFMKMIFSMDGKKIYGGQIVGGLGSDKRIDTLSVAMRLGASIEDLQHLEMAYAPPYSSAKDPVNMLGYVAENVLSGKVRFTDWDGLEKNPDALILDVRKESERTGYSIPGAVEVTLEELRDKLPSLAIPKDRKILIICSIGVRSYNAARILMQTGYENVLSYPCGMGFYRSTHYIKSEIPVIKKKADSPEKPAAISETAQKLGSGTAESKVIKLDCSGLQCPGPIMKVFEAVKEMNTGELLEVSASDPGFVRDIDAWCRRTGNTLVDNGKRGREYFAVLRKGIAASEDPITAEGTSNDAALATSSKNERADGKTLIVFSGDLDKVLASFIIANGAAAMGRPVTMFFTFWGLNALRKPEKQNVKKTLMESMFGAMMPRGADKLKLSNMNMGGMGAAMMRKIMKDKNVNSLEELIASAMKAGVKIVACTMSMDVMGIKPEELIEGVELAGVGSYLGDAEESNVNLFI